MMVHEAAGGFGKRKQDVRRYEGGRNRFDPLWLPLGAEQ